MQWCPLSSNEIEFYGVGSDFSPRLKSTRIVSANINSGAFSSVVFREKLLLESGYRCAGKRSEVIPKS